MKTTLKVGDIAEIRFLDHCEDGDTEALDFIVYGRVSQVGRKVIEVTSWGYADGKRHNDPNEKRFSIVRSAITQIRKLK